MDQRFVRDILAGKTYFIRTFGCQMNQHDSERVSGLLDSYGCLMALDPEHADIVVFMTCCVREAADTRLYGQCNSCKSLPPSPSGKRVVAVGGCIAQRDGEGLLTNVDNVNVIFGTHSIAHVAELIAEAFMDGKRHIRTNEHEDTDAMSMPWHRETQYHAWVPIMTGCNNFCTYCIVPYVRGREKSRPFEEIVDEVTGLVRQGVREITLLGQNVNSYGRDLFGKPRFADLLRAVSHDIRTPLTGIVGATNVLLEQDGTLTQEQREQLLRSTNEDAQWLIRIVENLLSITRISSEEARVKKLPEPAEEVIESAVAKTHKHYPEVDIRVHLPDELMMVPMDPLLIEQVLVNLMENAVIHGETNHIDVSLREEGSCAVITVSDDGRGIPQHLLPKLFEGSARSDRSQDGKRSMGIGLSVCRTIVLAHGGVIRGDNKPGGGAVFTVTLPMKGESDED